MSIGHHPQAVGTDSVAMLCPVSVQRIPRRSATAKAGKECLILWHVLVDHARSEVGDLKLTDRLPIHHDRHEIKSSRPTSRSMFRTAKALFHPASTWTSRGLSPGISGQEHHCGRVDSAAYSDDAVIATGAAFPAHLGDRVLPQACPHGIRVPPLARCRLEPMTVGTHPRLVEADKRGPVSCPTTTVCSGGNCSCSSEGLAGRIRDMDQDRFVLSDHNEHCARGHSRRRRPRAAATSDGSRNSPAAITGQEVREAASPIVVRSGPDRHPSRIKRLDHDLARQPLPPPGSRCGWSTRWEPDGPAVGGHHERRRW